MAATPTATLALPEARLVTLADLGYGDAGYGDGGDGGVCSDEVGCTVKSTGELQFVALSGGSSIGASCYLVRAGDTSVLVDCGIHPEHDPTETYMTIDKRARAIGLVLSLADISAFVLTHAHTDHSGLVPALYRHCRRANNGHMPYFFMTAATKHLLPHIYRNILRFSSSAPYDEGDVHELLQHARVPASGWNDLAACRRERGLRQAARFQDGTVACRLHLHTHYLVL